MTRTEKQVIQAMIRSVSQFLGLLKRILKGEDI